MVRTHPETGRKALFVNIAHTARFTGWSEEESAPLLQYLFAHQVKPEFTCRFVWRPGSLAFWDNRCAQHNPVNDYHGYRRLMHRITLAGGPAGLISRTPAGFPGGDVAAGAHQGGDDPEHRAHAQRRAHRAREQRQQALLVFSTVVRMPTASP